MRNDEIELESIFRTSDPDRDMKAVKEALGKGGYSYRGSFSKDPLDRALSMALDLALNEVLDPHDVDLSRFSSLYMEKVKNADEVDFVTAGKIVLMAWSVLKLQSDLALRGASEDGAGDDASIELDMSDWDWLSDDESFDFTRGVLTNKKAPISERLTRKNARKVTLLDLIEALESSKKELSRKDRRRAERERQKLMRSRAGRKELQRRVIDEIVENIDETWSIISERKRVKIDDLYEREDEMVMAFGSILQLAFDGKVELSQEDFPFGEIWVLVRGGS